MGYNKLAHYGRGGKGRRGEKRVVEVSQLKSIGGKATGRPRDAWSCCAIEEMKQGLYSHYLQFCRYEWCNKRAKDIPSSLSTLEHRIESV